MPPSRLTYRRRSSLAPSTLNHIKPGIYGAPSPSPRSVTFAPNVTPGTFNESGSLDDSTSEPSSPSAQLFPPSELPPPPPVRRRVPPGKRRSLGYIPRPPNAFMLFRADFVRQKHVPGSIETNHGSLSKIIGNCWRALPLEEKRVWEIRAKKAKEEHSAMYPGYRFRPVHNKDKSKKKPKTMVVPEDDQRCEAVAQLLLEGKKGDELAAAIRKLDQRIVSMPAPHLVCPHRRSSSVPLPDSYCHPIALPSLPFLQMGSRAGSPVGNISRSARMLMGQRRPSSVQPIPSRSWGTITPVLFLQHDVSPLPEVDNTLFDPAFLDAGFSMHAPDASFNFNELYTVAPHTQSPNFSLASLDVAPKDITFHPATTCDPSTMPHYATSGINMDMGINSSDPVTWLPTGPTAFPEFPEFADLGEFAQSQPSSAYSGSPAHSDVSLPVAASQQQFLQQNPGMSFEAWQDNTLIHKQASPTPASLSNMEAQVGLDGLFNGSFGVEAAGSGEGLTLGFDYVPL
ncbi:hypothetical protein V8B97DRAFT_1870461 [Scleroderma yunnanense]